MDNLLTRQLIDTQAHHTVPFVLLATVTCQLAHDNCPVLSRKLLTVAPSYQFPVTCDQEAGNELQLVYSFIGRGS